MLTMFKDDPNLFEIFITGEKSWLFGYDTETKAQLSQWRHPVESRPKTHVKFSEVWRFYSLISLIAMSRCIMNSYHKVVLSIRNTILNLIAWSNSSETHRIVENQSWILQHDNTPAHALVLVLEFSAKKKSFHASTTVFTLLGLCWLFPLPKTKDTDERKACCNDWGDKRWIETGAVGDT